MPVRRTLLVAAIALSVSAPAQAAPAAEICASRAGLYATPDGAVVGVLRDGDTVLVLRRGATWWRVKARFGTRGWVRSRLLCAEDR